MFVSLVNIMGRMLFSMCKDFLKVCSLVTFFFSVIRHHDHGNVGKKELIRGLQYQRVNLSLSQVVAGKEEVGL